MWLTLQKLPAFPSCFFTIRCVSWSEVFHLPWEAARMVGLKWQDVPKLQVLTLGGIFTCPYFLQFLRAA